MSDIDRVIERVRKMLALANDAGASEGERENAMRMAHATLAKYNLDLASIGPTPDKPRGVEPRVQHRAAYYGRPWARLVSQAVAELMFCRYLFIQNSRAEATVHIFIGSHANSVSAQILAEFLVESITREGRARQRAAGAGNDYFRSFATGAAAAIALRAEALKAAHTGPGGASGSPPPSDPATPGAPGSAIVLAGLYDREAAANEAVVGQLAPKPLDPSFRNVNASAAAEGMRYGSKVSLNRQVK